MKTIEFHILQNFPPSNLNRDDTGSPKDCDFGGHRRQRISSQCLKQSVRKYFRNETEAKLKLGYRTAQAPSKVIKLLEKSGLDQETAQLLGIEFFEALHGLDGEMTKYLLFVGDDELQRMADFIINNSETIKPVAEQLAKLRLEKAQAEKGSDEAKKADNSIKAESKKFGNLTKKYKKEFEFVHSVDIALFGRMLAKSIEENVDAACQVSHAISVNAMNLEFDYFTAMDDLPKPDSKPGAEMIGTVLFSSSCFYRFACVNMSQLTHNLGGDAKAAGEGVLAFAEAFVQARPSGKQNTFAAHSLPALVMVVMRESGQPVSLVNAFENPVKPGQDESLTSRAIESLSAHYGKLQKMYGLNGQAACVILDAEDKVAQALQAAGVETLDSVPALLKTLKASLAVKPEPA